MPNTTQVRPVLWKSKVNLKTRKIASSFNTNNRYKLLHRKSCTFKSRSSSIREAPNSSPSNLNKARRNIKLPKKIPGKINTNSKRNKNSSQLNSNRTSANFKTTSLAFSPRRSS